MREVLGSNRPELKHMQELHILMATITEVQRLSKVAPFSLPHHLAEDFHYKGQFFPKNSMWRVNLGYIMKDPDHFHNPSEFNPARFLDSNTGKFVKNERVIPFGIGKRVCMGELLARNEVYLFAANLVQKLEFQPPADHPLPDKDSFTSQVSTIPTDFYVKIKSTDM
jgi:cytochrome P450